MKASQTLLLRPTILKLSKIDKHISRTPQSENNIGHSPEKDNERNSTLRLYIYETRDVEIKTSEAETCDSGLEIETSDLGLGSWDLA